MAGTTDRRLRIGRVARPHGTGGAFYVAEPTERLDLLETGRRVYIGDHALVVAWRRGVPERPVIKLEAVDDRAAAEDLRGHAITVPRGELGPLREDEYLIDDLIGCVVTEDRLVIGRVRDVLALPSVEALAVDRGAGEELLIPLVQDAVEAIDVEERRIDVNARFLRGEW